MALTICTRNETNKDGSVLLHVRFRANQLDKKIPTKIKVIRKHWDDRHKRLKPSHPFYGLVNKKITELKKTVDELYDQSVFAVLKYEEARNRISGGSHLDDVISYMDQHLKTQIKESSFNSYRLGLCSIAKHFNGTKKISFEELCDKNNWLKLKEKFQKLERSPATFNSYRRSAKAIHNHARKDDITFTSFSYVRGLASKNLEPKWMRSDELIKVINGLDVNDEHFELSVTSILIYLMMFSMRGLYVQDVLLLSMDRFVEDLYENKEEYLFGEKNMVYKHNRSKTNKMGLIYMGLDPIKEIVFLFNKMIDPTCKSLFPVKGVKDLSFYQKLSRTFKLITGFSYKSVRKAFQTTGSILSVPDADMRELMFQNDRTISAHYKDTQAPQMLEKYTKYHSDILEKYRVNDMFKMLKKKLKH